MKDFNWPLWYLEELPPNRPLYKDSDTWYIYNDDMTVVLYEQMPDETFEYFIERVYCQEGLLTRQRYNEICDLKKKDKT